MQFVYIFHARTSVMDSMDGLKLDDYKTSWFFLFNRLQKVHIHFFIVRI